MAIRSTGGTGVLVALVVFVLTTVFLLVMTIVFYSGKDKATVKMNEAEAKLAEFITASQRGDDAARALQAAATNERDSVFGYLVKRKADVAEFVTGDRAAELPTMRSVLGVPENSNLKDHLADVRRHVADVTRYPLEILTPDADFEDDLGVDSVKQAEILATITAEFPAAAGINPRAEGLRWAIGMTAKGWGTGNLGRQQGSSLTYELLREDSSMMMSVHEDQYHEITGFLQVTAPLARSARRR
jgi:hypothetical protein